MKVLWVTIALLLAGCAGTSEDGTTSTKMTAGDAIAVYDENKKDLGAHEALGLIAHKGHKDLPWIIGENKAFPDSHGTLSGGTADHWNLLVYKRDSQEIHWYKIQDNLTLVESAASNTFGWNLEYNDATGSGAGRTAAMHGGHTCEFLTKFDDVGDSTQFDGSTIILLPSIHTHGDDCARSKPMGYEGIPDNAFYVDGAFYGHDGAPLTFEASKSTGRLNGFASLEAMIPATPVLPSSHSFTFESEGGLLQVHARLISGPDFYNDGTITLTSPSGSEESVVGDLGEWDIQAAEKGEWTLTMQWDTALPGTFNIAAQAVEIS